jgi:glycosyltransferase involved in cell wall biosynthesis
MPPRPRNIITVNTADRGGGAERRAWVLFKGFQQRGVSSWLVVGQKQSNDDRVVPFYQSSHIDYRWYDGPFFRLKERFHKWLARSMGWEDFFFPFSKYLLSIVGQRPDLVHCQNLHGGYFDLRVLAAISRQVPVFLTLHDCWAYTGHCAHSFDCERWRTGCGSCPYLSIPPALHRDGTRWNWRRKQRIYARSQLHVAAASEWLLQRARQSILAPAILSSRVIVPGVDLKVFRPAQQHEARRTLGIPLDVAMVVFVANEGRRNPFKDYATMQAAVSRLSAGADTQDVHWYCIGEAGPDERHGRVLIRHVPYQPTPDKLALYYQAADVYLHAARAEVFGLVIAEAMACGTPVVATRVGGIPEVFVDQEHGLLVPPGDPAAMAQAVARLLREPALRRRLGEQAAAHAHRHYDQEVMIDTYLDWFSECLEKRGLAA